jgi:cell division protein FtsQ
MSGFDTTQPRFFRPDDVGRLPRNYRRVQIQRLLVVARNAVIVLIVATAAFWMYRRTQSSARFAVKNIEVTGAVHTPAPQLQAITAHYVGLNLFKLDIARVQRDLGSLAWIRRIDIEKKLPDTLRIHVLERAPVALVHAGGKLHYVDETGLTFAELSPAVGDEDLPVIADAAGTELARSVAFVREMRARDPQLFSRISEVRPVAPRGFALFDRELGAYVYANADDVRTKWRNLYAVMRAEQLGKASIEYADLRFADRIVIKPVHTITASVAPAAAGPAAQITN